ncbi:hypothetical protein F2Q70_00033004 [Brassica cretica]|uniref:Uncharacterized protein n=1 Tax=Brassica cretica TaxID=69181 RepID=A0A8S9H2R2_BRACR|nr:hypothetical protein F2Q70_00033004 [Brassica cretica]KAF2552855.1 hypothetical protein F2Q68_00037373 [Brassica cretica]
MASKGMGRSTTVNYISCFRSHAFVVTITTPSGGIDLPSKLVRGFASRLIFGAGCSSDHSVSCEMMLTALPVSTRIFERMTLLFLARLLKRHLGLLIVPRVEWERLSRLSTSLDVIVLLDLRIRDR